MTDPRAHDVERLFAAEARLDALESRLAIEDMHSTFVRAVADRDFTSLVDYFTADATIDMRTHGPKTGTGAIAEHFSHMVTMPLDGAGYLLSSPVVAVSGDTAQGVWTWHRLHSTATVAGRSIRSWGVWEEGRYECEYRRGDDGRWRFSRMHFRVVRPDADDAEVSS